MKILRTGVAGLAGFLTASLIAACTSVGQGNNNYVSGDGTVTEYGIEGRGDPLEFTGVTDRGTTVSSADYRGEVLVVNFWYAACPPCRLEAPDLQALSEEFAGDGVTFLGVNIRDGAETSLSFAETFGVTYPSIIDRDGQVTLAFSGLASPTAVPTTVVIDRDGRASARIVGLLEPSTLRALIHTALDED
ncbi:MAG: thiol-disulfide isomerase [Micrococcales bacterium 70-64]|nr:MAG: thiol-disulfide isomerase [Leifsonia sp. SCN 70-46]OJX86123.1 MAG: thiol-disulfide isomerase [Micrococcales bacterium 70-64]